MYDGRIYKLQAWLIVSDVALDVAKGFKNQKYSFPNFKTQKMCCTYVKWYMCEVKRYIISFKSDKPLT